MGDPAFTLTKEQLAELVKQAVRDVLNEEPAEATAKPLTEEDLARARKSLRRFGRGR